MGNPSNRLCVFGCIQKRSADAPSACAGADTELVDVKSIRARTAVRLTAARVDALEVWFGLSSAGAGVGVSEGTERHWRAAEDIGDNVTLREPPLLRLKSKNTGP
jgi:hypothetical protein